MGRLRLLLLATSVTLVAAGCATTTTTTFHTGNSDSDQVWVGTLDAVSNYLNVALADREKGTIEARSDGQWERNLARIEIRRNANQYDITVGGYVETSKVLTRPSGLRAGEEEHLSDLNTGLRDALVTEIKQRLAVPAKVSLGEPAKKSGALAPEKPNAAPQKKASEKPKGWGWFGSTKKK